MNGNKYLSRSFWIVVVFGLMGFILSWYLKEALAFTTVASVGLGGWFGGKAVEAYQTRNKPL